MVKGLKTSELGMLPKTLKLDIIANNLANINTVGFKRSNLFLRELIKADISLRDGNSSRMDTNIAQAQVLDLSQGALQETKNPLDLGIYGRGFFVIETNDGLRYTRNGNFTLSSDGALVNAQGYKVIGEKGIIFFPNPTRIQENQITVTKNGDIFFGKELIDKLKIIDFPEDYSQVGLQYAGENLLAAQDDSLSQPVKNTDLEIKQGYLESSNVNALEEMVKLIELNSSIQADQKAIRYQDQTLQISNEIGKI